MTDDEKPDSKDVRDRSGEGKPRRDDANARLVRVGMRLLGGATTVKEALAPENLAESTVRNAKRNGYGRTIAMRAALAVLPEVNGNTLPELDKKADSILAMALELEKGERPDSLAVQTAVAVKKLAQDAPEMYEPPKMVHSSRQYRAIFSRLSQRAYRLGMEFALGALQHGDVELVHARIAAARELPSFILADYEPPITAGRLSGRRRDVLDAEVVEVVEEPIASPQAEETTRRPYRAGDQTEEW